MGIFEMVRTEPCLRYDVALWHEYVIVYFYAYANLWHCHQAERRGL